MQLRYAREQTAYQKRQTKVSDQQTDARLRLEHVLQLCGSCGADLILSLCSSRLRWDLIFESAATKKAQESLSASIAHYLAHWPLAASPIPFHRGSGLNF